MTVKSREPTPDKYPKGVRTRPGRTRIMGKTGGGRGTNQYQVKGRSIAQDGTVGGATSQQAAAFDLDPAESVGKAMTVREIRHRLFNVENQEMTVRELRAELFESSKPEDDQLRKTLYDVEDQELTVRSLRQALFAVDEQDENLDLRSI